MTAAGALIATAALALRVPPASTRRQAVISGAALATTGALSRPASAFEFGFDLTRSGEAIGHVKKAPPGEKQNSGIKLLRETFDGGLPEDGLLKWYDEHLASDFEAVFAGGKVVLDKKVRRRRLAELRRDPYLPGWEKKKNGNGPRKTYYNTKCQEINIPIYSR